MSSFFTELRKTSATLKMLLTTYKVKSTSTKYLQLLQQEQQGNRATVFDNKDLI